MRPAGLRCLAKSDTRADMCDLRDSVIITKDGQAAFGSS